MHHYKMEIKKEIVIIIGILLVLPILISAQDISSCGYLSTENEIYNLDKNLISPEITNKCFNINANNITLDCQGHSIISLNNYSIIYIKSKNDIKVQNCTIGTANGIGIDFDKTFLYFDPNWGNRGRGYYSGCARANIQNNIFTNNKHGIRIRPADSQNMVIENNNFTDNSYAIYQRTEIGRYTRDDTWNYYSDYNTIKNNNMNQNNYGFYAYRPKGTKFINNNITNNQGNAIRLESQGRAILFNGNQIKYNQGNGIQLDLVYDVKVINNNISYNSLSGLKYVQGGFSNISKNIFIGNGNYGFYTNIWDSNMDYNIVCDNGMEDFYCISHTPFYYQFIGTGNYFDKVVPCPARAAQSYKDKYPYQDDPGWPILNNDYTACPPECYENPECSEMHECISWHCVDCQSDTGCSEVGDNFCDGDMLYNCVDRVNGCLQRINQSTCPVGWCKSGEGCIEPPISIDNCGILDEAGKTYLLTKNLEDEEVVSDYGGNCLSIEANNIILDCGGHYIKNEDFEGVAAIYSNQDYTTIKNCSVSLNKAGYSFGIRFIGNSHNTILNNNLTNNTAGIFLSYSSNNLIQNNIAPKNTYYGVYFEDGSQNSLVSNIFCDNNPDIGCSLPQTVFTNNQCDIIAPLCGGTCSSACP